MLHSLSSPSASPWQRRKVMKHRRGPFYQQRSQSHITSGEATILQQESVVARWTRVVYMTGTSVHSQCADQNVTASSNAVLWGFPAIGILREVPLRFYSNSQEHPVPIQEYGCLNGARTGGVFTQRNPTCTRAHSDLLHTGRHLPKIAVCQEAEGAANSVTFYSLQAMLSHPTASSFN